MELVIKDEYTCLDFEELSRTIEKLRYEILFSFDEAGCSPIAEQHYLLALNSLELAQRHMKMALYYQMKAM